MTALLLLTAISYSPQQEVINFHNEVATVIGDAYDVARTSQEFQDITILRRLNTDLGIHISRNEWSKAGGDISRMKPTFARTSVVAKSAGRRRAQQEHREHVLDRAQQERFHRDDMRLRMQGY